MYFSDLYMTEDDAMIGLYYNYWPSHLLYLEVAPGQLYDVPLTKHRWNKLEKEGSAPCAEITTEDYSECIRDWARSEFARADCKNGSNTVV